MEQAAGELASVSEQLSAAPKLADTPRRLGELQIMVADFGSQVSSLLLASFEVFNYGTLRSFFFIRLVLML